MKPAQYNGKIFLNPVPTEVSGSGAFFKILKAYFKKHPNVHPAKPLGPFKADLNNLHHLSPDACRITWLGHSTVLFEMAGTRILTDPVWYQRVSPFLKLGPKRFYEAPVRIEDLPPIDIVLLSHDHYDHLDKGAVQKLAEKGSYFLCPLHVGRHLKTWGIKENSYTEMDWGQQKTIDNIQFTFTPARHFSGRWLNDRFTTLWGAFAIRSKEVAIFYGADSGYYEGFKEIGETLGPFDVTLLNIGAYNELWESIHMFPEDAVQAHIDLKGKVFMPIHWGTFNLALHPWTEPVERVITAAEKRNVPLLLLPPGYIWKREEGPKIINWWEQ